jgi:hypothetical protein
MTDISKSITGRVTRAHRMREDVRAHAHKQGRELSVQQARRNAAGAKYFGQVF